MTKLKLTARLKGVGSINNAYIYLEDIPSANLHATPIGMFPKSSSKKEWENSKISIEVDGDLEYQLNVHAFSGTDWEFELLSIPGNKKILSLSGTTGVNEQAGISKNASVVTGSVPV